ncbi:MAG: hypothetical protein M3R04_09720 [bacterium]|nr:hypothetical protein [bacterium]
MRPYSKFYAFPEEITVTSTLGAKGLGADVVFLVGFDKKKFPAKAKPEMAEIYQMLVALTRAKKRVYLVSTFQCEVSEWAAAGLVDRNLS